LSRVTTLTLGGSPHGREQQLTLAGQLTTYQPLNVGNRDGDDVGGMGTGQPLDVAWILAVAASSTDAPLGPPAIIAAFAAANAAAMATTRTNAAMTNTGEAPRWRPMEAPLATNLGRHTTRSKAEKGRHPGEGAAWPYALAAGSGPRRPDLGLPQPDLVPGEAAAPRGDGSSGSWWALHPGEAVETVPADPTRKRGAACRAQRQGERRIHASRRFSSARARVDRGKLGHCEGTLSTVYSI